MKEHFNEPLILNFNRVKRAYTGGKLLDEWQGLSHPEDGNYSEEFLISTVEVTNENKKAGDGLSTTTLEDGAEVYLRDLIASDYENYLGQDYQERKSLGVSARIGDTNVRLVLQCHPDQETAQNKLGFSNGKAEAWYIMETREINGEKPCLWAGFKKGITKEKWRKLFEAQDVAGMLAWMHKIAVHKGGVYFVPPGMPHCMGAGCLFLEIHEPCDYTFRMEKNYLNHHIFSDEEMHNGLGFDGLMEAFHYDGMTEAEIEKLCVPDHPQVLKNDDDGTLTEIISYQVTDRFKAEFLTVKGAYPLDDFENGHRIMVVTKGDAILGYDGKVKKARQGRGVFLPSGLKGMQITPAGASVETVICYPPQMPFKPRNILGNPIQNGIF